MNLSTAFGTALGLAVSGLTLTGLVYGSVQVVEFVADDDDRSFSGTVTSEAVMYGDTIEVEIDGNMHELADVTVRSYENCGGAQNRELLATARGLLPVGTKVDGYLGSKYLGMYDAGEVIDGKRTNIEPASYLHLGAIESTPSVSETLVSTGWGAAWQYIDDERGLDVGDAIILREHNAVVAAEKIHETPGEVFCANHEREANEREWERDRRRARHHLIAAAAARHHREQLALKYGEYDYEHGYYVDGNGNPIHSSGSGGGYNGPRCYDSDGHTYTAC